MFYKFIKISPLSLVYEYKEIKHVGTRSRTDAYQWANLITITGLSNNGLNRKW